MRVRVTREEIERMFKNLNALPEELIFLDATPISDTECKHKNASYYESWVCDDCGTGNLTGFGGKPASSISDAEECTAKCVIRGMYGMKDFHYHKKKESTEECKDCCAKVRKTWNGFAPTCPCGCHKKKESTEEKVCCEKSHHPQWDCQRGCDICKQKESPQHRRYCKKSGLVCLVIHTDGCPDVKDCEAYKVEGI